MTGINEKFKIRFPGIILFLFLISLVTPTDSPNIHIGSYSIDTAILRSGDIIFRRGTSFVSNLVLTLDKRTPYSHTGIVNIIEKEVYIIHSVPGEEPGEKDITKIDPLELFLRRDRTTSVSVYRLINEDSLVSTNASVRAYEYGIAETEFDNSFDLSDDSRLYCTELIWKVYLESGTDLINGKFDKVEIPLSNGPYILPGTLLESDKLKQIYSINFK